MKKYIPVFGPQELFDGAANCDEYLVAVQHSVGQKTKISFCPSLVEAFNYVVDFPPRGVVFHRAAMRKIEEVPEPKHWTAEDQKAGRLPEVGAKCRQGHKDEIVVAVTEKFVVTECQDMSVCTTRKDVFMRSYNPIETPAEKAQRERDEWIDNACSFICFYDIGRVDAIKSLEITYDKLKSGELSMPVKGGE